MADTDILVLEGIALGSARGKASAPLHMAYKRDLTVDDLDLLLNPPAKGIETNPLLRLRLPHHNLAKLLAQGVPQAEASLITGYSQSRISILKNDPSFAELIAHYREHVEEAFSNATQKLATLGESAVEILQERLLDDPEKVSTGQLREIIETAFEHSIAPMTGRAQKTGPTRIEINLISPKAEKESGLTIDVEPTR